MNNKLYKVGQHLFTKDGRIVGNAIITEATTEGLFRIETDFGNGGLLLNANEVDEWWYASDIHGEDCISDVEQWRRDRKQLRGKHSEIICTKCGLREQRGEKLNADF